MDHVILSRTSARHHDDRCLCAVVIRGERHRFRGRSMADALWRASLDLGRGNVIRACGTNPMDRAAFAGEVPLEVYADWLEERGVPRDKAQVRIETYHTVHAALQEMEDV